MVRKMYAGNSLLKLVTLVLYSVRVELSPSLKKGAVCMECKVRYFLTYCIHSALKYILILFITFTRECHANRPRFSTCSRRYKGEETEVVNKGGCCECL